VSNSLSLRSSVCLAVCMCFLKFLKLTELKLFRNCVDSVGSSLSAIHINVCHLIRHSQIKLPLLFQLHESHIFSSGFTICIQNVWSFIYYFHTWFRGKFWQYKRKKSFVKHTFEISKFMTAANIQLHISLSKPQRVQNCYLWTCQ
jgi:hypothetical protein